MDFKKLYKYFPGLLIISFILPLTNGCSEVDKKNIDNTYYVELVNFSKDSLKQVVSDKLFGKVAFYKNNKLEIMSLNYVTEDYPDMHYFNNSQGLGKEIKPETKKIKIEFLGEYAVDSISYSLQKFRYRNNQWVKTSDMGFLQARNEYKNFIIEEFARQIMYNTVLYTYDQ
ncbi:MAG: hypothetical protein ABIO79_17160 [Ferruginibacter sp.]